MVGNAAENIPESGKRIDLYEFDGFGDLIQQASPDTGITVYGFDAAGNLVQTVDAAGIITNNAYDSHDRIISTT
jgi:YD repeat-containing protein